MSSFSLRLDGGGERVDLHYDKTKDFQVLDMYQKSHVRRYEFAQSRVVDGSVIGDFACGTGYGSIILSKKAAHVIGIDFNENVIKHIRSRYRRVGNVSFNCKNLLDLGYESYFDSIVSFETIEHFNEPDLARLFGTFSRALKKGGKLILSTPYMQERSVEAVTMGFHLTFNINEEIITRWLKNNDLICECFKYQNYQAHDVVDSLDEKDFIVCIARKSG